MLALEPKLTPESRDWSYQQHAAHERAYVAAGELPSYYGAPESVDAWRHVRMYETLLPLIETFPQSRWLTLGDGGFGSDANFLLRRGVPVVASSLTDASLERAKEMGWIDEFKAINAEEISEPANAYDFVLCKESYHHFPRAPIALYEMLRVARVGVVLIEPIDSKGRLLDRAKALGKKLLRGDKTQEFETCGNFIFRVSLSEMRKALCAQNYRCLAYKTFNDFWHPKFSRAQNTSRSLGSLVTRMGMKVQDALCALRLLSPGLATVVLLKDTASAEFKRQLNQHKFKVVDLPKNPYCGGDATADIAEAAPALATVGQEVAG